MKEQDEIIDHVLSFPLEYWSEYGTDEYYYETKKKPIVIFKLNYLEPDNNHIKIIPSNNSRILVLRSPKLNFGVKIS